MSICKDCFHSYVCEQFNEHRECDNKKCHFANDHFVPTDLINRQKEENEQSILNLTSLQNNLTDLQAENENLKDVLYDADGVNLVNYWYQQCKIAENGCRNYGEENKNLKAEIERLKDILICFMGALSKVRNIDDIESISAIPLMTELNKGIRAEIKAEAYKEFVEKLCEGRVSNDNTVILAKRLLKELVGEDNA